MAYIAVVGAANVDIGGFPAGRVIEGDSNPGRVRTSMGETRTSKTLPQ